MPDFKFKQVDYNVQLGGVDYETIVHPEMGDSYTATVMPQDKFVWYFFNEVVNHCDNPDWSGMFHLRKVEKGWAMTYESNGPLLVILKFKRFPNWARR